uniref:PH domain-containing protein n=1 Tax=Seriola lalandi dorsalis TaxID=1841481 RepID=A0A3B4XQ89_SERLL
GGGGPKLCGFLQKQGGPLRAWKQRWFTYEEKKNQLFYYRTPQDVTPLGRVELSCATFTYPLKAESGTFHIKTPERTFILKVKGTGRPGLSQPLRQLLLFASVSRTT